LTKLFVVVYWLHEALLGGLWSPTILEIIKMIEEVLPTGTKVWVHSMERAGMIIRIERDLRNGPQYLVSIHDPENIEDTHPYIHRWVKNTDLEPTNKRSK